MHCFECKYMKWLTDSEDRTIYFCTNADSGAYLSETDNAGHCDWVEEQSVNTEIHGGAKVAKFKFKKLTEDYEQGEFTLGTDLTTLLQIMERGDF